jgi:Domain of unknown function (DUF4296)
MRTGLLIIYFSLIIAGCKSKDAIPGSVLPQKKMQAVLWDMMRADQFLADYVLNKDTSLKKKTESIKLYQQILAINGVTKEKFERSFSFYKSHPLLLKVIMDSIFNASPEPAVDSSRHDPVKDSLKTTVDSVTVKDTAIGLKKLKRLRLKSN